MKAQMVKNAVIVPSRRQGRLRVARAAGESRSAARRGGVAVLDADPRHARSDRQHRRRRGRAPGGRARLRRGRSVPRRGGGQGHRRALGHRQCDRARVRILARRRLRVGWLEGLRPQAARHHRARCLGERQAAFPRARPRRRLASVHGRGDRRHVRRRLRQRHVAVAPDPARRGLRPPPRLPRPRRPIRPPRSQSAGGCSRWAPARRGTTTTTR